MNQPSHTSELLLTPRTQRWLALLWLLLAAPVVAAYGVGFWASWSAPPDVCAEFGPDCTPAAAAAALARIGLTPLAALLIAGLIAEVGVPVGTMLMGLFLFWRRSDRAITLAVAGLLLLYGPVINTELADSGLARLGLGALVRPYHLLFEALFYYVLLTFPTGRFAPRWAWVLWAMGSGSYLVYGFAGQEPPPAVLLLALAALAVQIYRYRIADAVQRQQAKWGLAGLVLFLTNFVLYVLVVGPKLSQGVDGLVALVAFMPLNLVLVLSLPVALLIASLRYRLWDIDVIIRRTLVYSTLTTLLAAIYLGLIISLQALMQQLTHAAQGPLVTVLSTLAIAALFGPLRRRVQAVIDRRFYRRAYNAGQIVAAFGETLRAELELDHVAAQLVETAAVTLQPRHAQVWLKPLKRDRPAPPA